MIFKRQKEINPFPFWVYYYNIVFIAFIGLADSIYLAVSHYRVYTDIGYKSFCAVSKAINCDTVSQSAYSIFLTLPLPVWGIFGYSLFLLICLMQRFESENKARLLPALSLISFAFCCHSFILAYISIYRIKSYCIMCILSYAVNFALLYFTWLTRKRFEKLSLIKGIQFDFGFIWHKRRKAAFVLLPYAAVVGIVFFIFPDYWHMKMNIDTNVLHQGMTPDGHPWIGALHPEIEIEEFTDYECFQCRKMHFFLRQLMTKYPEKIRLIHRHFPMDHEFNFIVEEPFHVGSGYLALIAIFAAKQGKFWQINDILYEIGSKKGMISTNKIAKETGLDPGKLSRAIRDPELRYLLAVDIWKGVKLGITGTPAFVIEGKVHQGNIPPEILKRIIE